MTNQTPRKENSTINDVSLIERLVGRENMKKAYSRVVANKGAPGVDKMTVDELMPYLKENWARIKDELLKGRYKPKPVKRVEVPKPNGGVRKLGIPTVLDRLIQQAIHQTLGPIYEPLFSKSSYGFRKGKNAHQAIKQARKIQEQGNIWVVDMDLEKFFDRVNHDRLMSRVAYRIKDKKILKLIRAYLNAGVMDGGIVSPSVVGTPQGGPLSPLLSNIVLDDLDKELERRGHLFCRYADDCNIYVKTKRSGERVLESISNFIEEKLKLKVNKDKSKVAKPSTRKFLGYSFLGGKNPKIRVPKESVAKLKKKLKQVFRKSMGRNLSRFTQEEINPVVRGWINYFVLAETKEFADKLDGWIRRRLRLMLWRQWKRPWTRRKRLISVGLEEERAVRSSFNRRGPWWNSGASHMNQAFPKSFFDSLGLVSMLDKLNAVRC